MSNTMVAGVGRWLAGKALRLPARKTGRVSVEKNVPVRMRDGVELLADRYYAEGLPPGPVVLMRSPYGRGALFGVMAAFMAERGLQVLAQSVRGTAGSGGKFDPMRQERADGADTLDWVRAQSWYTGKIFTFGPSYLGNTQWAMASVSADSMDGLVLPMTLSNFRDEFLGFGAFTQGGMLEWTQLIQSMMDMGPGQRMQRPKAGALDPVHTHLPVGALDEVAFGKTVSWWQDWVHHDDPQDPWWQALDYSDAVTAVAAPAVMIAGWQDVFLPFQLKDYAARQAAGREVWLTIGPWSHSAPGGMLEGLRQAMGVFARLAAGQPAFADRGRVRLFLQGAAEWRDYPSWPPPGVQPLQFHLRSGGHMDLSGATGDEGGVSYVYDPAEPTPAVHGPRVMGMAKVRNMAGLEKRADTVTFTSAALDHDIDVIGAVSVELSVRSDREHTDFYACLCDVDKKGRPMQVVDGIIRLKPGQPDADSSGVRRISIACWPTAYRFRRGHRLRLIIASGAHPRYARNPGTGDPLATATELLSAHQEILLGSVHGSSLNLQALPDSRKA